ncbi:hypothetical protein L210DRAFT_3755841 [Boletus edulis BED1]|uniref:DUF6533 domain-containing protein n=1 Tax=Boletus edulis BED1 TaxID=1328754 RepID=A0AAD4C9K8_BOLED|nr:hypothetical protein L210DRAFT_3755841 [Boletus edulis BED1]
MSSDIQSALELIVLNNYLSVLTVTAVVYDYILTFSREVEYIWLRPWTWVSTMFVVVRYIGLCWIMTNAFVMMISRVYAMWNRSRTILSILLLIYVPQTISSIILDGIYNNPNTRTTVTVVQFLDFSFCSFSFINTPATLRVYRAVPRFVLSSELVILAVLQTLKQSFEMYKATKQWQPNRYMQKLVGDGILYFFVNVLYQVDTLALFTAPSDIVFLNVFLCIPFYTLIPRFIISIRELYDHDIRGRFHIDTGFGLRSRSNPGLDTTVSAMVFVGGDQGPEVEGGTDNPGNLELGIVGRRLSHWGQGVGCIRALEDRAEWYLIFISGGSASELHMQFLFL